MDGPFEIKYQRQYKLKQNAISVGIYPIKFFAYIVSLKTIHDDTNWR